LHTRIGSFFRALRCALQRSAAHFEILSADARFSAACILALQRFSAAELKTHALQWYLKNTSAAAPRCSGTGMCCKIS
jgi:hypothetical protein